MEKEKENTSISVIDVSVDKALTLYEITPAKVAEMAKQYDSLKVVEDDKKSYKNVKSACMMLVHTRTSVDKRRKKLGEDARALLSSINTAAKQLLDPIEKLEERFKAEMKVEDDRLQAIKDAAESAEKSRVAAIIAKIDLIKSYVPLVISKPSDKISLAISRLNDMFFDIKEVEYQEYTAQAKQCISDTIAILQPILDDKIKAEQEAITQKAESDRLEKIRQDQEAEQKRLDQIRIDEEAKARKERELIEEEKRKLQAEKDHIEAEKKADKERKERAEFEHQAILMAKAKAEQEAKDKVEREAKEAVEKAKREQEEAEHAEAMRPDKEKLIAFSKAIENLKAPVLSSNEMDHILSSAISTLKLIAKTIRKNVDEL